MADIPINGGDTPAPVKRGRKPRVAVSATPESAIKAAAPRATAAKTRKNAANGATPAPRKPRATAAPKPAAKRASRKTGATKPDTGTPKRFAIGVAALAGIAAGIAALLGRKKIAKVTNDAIDAVTGSTEPKAAVPTMRAD